MECKCAPLYSDASHTYTACRVCTANKTEGVRIYSLAGQKYAIGCIAILTALLFVSNLYLYVVYFNLLKSFAEQNEIIKKIDNSRRTDCSYENTHTGGEDFKRSVRSDSGRRPRRHRKRQAGNCCQTVNRKLDALKDAVWKPVTQLKNASWSSGGSGRYTWASPSAEYRENFDYTTTTTGENQCHGIKILMAGEYTVSVQITVEGGSVNIDPQQMRYEVWKKDNNFEMKLMTGAVTQANLINIPGSSTGPVDTVGVYGLFTFNHNDEIYVKPSYSYRARFSYPQGDGSLSRFIVTMVNSNPN